MRRPAAPSTPLPPLCSARRPHTGFPYSRTLTHARILCLPSIFMRPPCRNQLIGKCARAGKRFDDTSISPVIRQSLLHWGYELTQKDADAYVKLKGLPTLPR